MASSNSVPSRTAINALRGVLLTTSCSVILLAEERRQRLKIARAAYDNARKLHTARVNRNSVAVSESFGQREAYPAELGDFSRAGNPQNPIRRRRRNGQPSRAQLTPESVEYLPSSQPSPSFGNLEREAPDTRRNWAEWDAARKEISRLSTLSPFAHSELFLRMSTDETPISLQHNQQSQGNRDLPPQPEPSVLANVQPGGHAESREANLNRAPGTPDAAQNASVLKQDTKAGALLRAVFMDEDIVAATRPFQPTSAPIKDDDATKPSTNLLELDQLISDLKSPGNNQVLVSEKLQSAIQLLQGLMSTNAIKSKLALARGISILESTVQFKEYGNLAAILDTLHPVCSEVCHLTVPALDYLYAQHDVEGTKQLLAHLSESEVWKVERTPHNLRNPWITRMLMHYWRKTQNFDDIKGIYSLLQDAGLFSPDTSLVTEYAIRRRIALIALDAGDDAKAKSEIASLQILRPKATENDVKVRARFMIRDATLGHWEAVRTQLEALKEKGHGKAGSHFQNALAWLTKIYCKDHSTAEVDIFVRDLVSIHGMELNQTLAFLVVDRHGRNRNLEALVQWIQFCHDSGFEMNQIFFNEVVGKCCKYWSLSRVDVVHMLEGIRAFMPDMHDPHVAKYSVHGALRELHRSLPGESSNGSNSSPVCGLPKDAGDSVTLFERTAFKCMNTLAQENAWQRVYDTFKEASEQGIGFSSRCLRLAVIANINLEGPLSLTATELVSQAHTKGNDVSGALVPLLVARLGSGEGVGGLLQTALDQGSRIHDSVYNKVVRILFQDGLQEGAIGVCTLAAQQNGKGELAYSQFNFASLIYAYTGQRRYDDLEALIKSFTSKTEWWQGSKECKESLKRAMKTVAKRTVRAPPAEQAMHKAALDALNSGLAHIKKHRATVRGDRQTLTREVIGAFKERVEVEEVKVDADVNVDVEFDSLEEDDALEVRMGNLRLTMNDQSRSQTGKSEAVQRKSRDKSQPAEVMSEQEELFIARQTLAGAFF